MRPTLVLATVGAGEDVAHYAYLPDSAMVSTVTMKHGPTEVLRVERQYDRLNRLTSIVNRRVADATVVSAHAYTYNDANQRTRAVLEDGSYWVYTYDALGQLTSGKRFWADDTPVAGMQFEYGYDDIGNRTATAEGGDSQGANLRAAAYSANALNQYTQRTVPGAFDVTGTAHPQAFVAVNGVTATRQGSYYRSEVLGDNANGPVAVPVQVQAVRAAAGPGGEDVVDRKSGYHVSVQSPEMPVRDLDGNTLSDGRYTYEWDAENRLVALTESLSVWVARCQAALAQGAPEPTRVRLTWTYDFRKRRRTESEFHWNAGTLAWEPAATRHWLWYRWLYLGVLTADRTPQVLYSYGLDLHGRMVPTRGAGGPLWAHTPAATLAAIADGGANIVGYATIPDVTFTAMAADPFGRVLAGGALSDALQGFGGKPRLAHTGILAFGRRDYHPDRGVWLSRDPIEERGGFHLYGFVRNDPANLFDRLGLEDEESAGPGMDDDEHPSLGQLVGGIVKAPFQLVGFLRAGVTNLTIDPIVAAIRRGSSDHVPAPPVPVGTPPGKGEWGAPGYGYPGPGRSVPMGHRPKDMFDLASAIHDLTLTSHGVDYFGSERIRDFNLCADPLTKSRKAKADYIFHKMTSAANYRWYGVAYSIVSDVTFSGHTRALFRKNDCFYNALADESLGRMEDYPYRLLIPLDWMLAEARRRASQEGFVDVDRTFDYPDEHWIANEHTLDMIPGWNEWKVSHVPNYAELSAISADTGK